MELVILILQLDQGTESKPINKNLMLLLVNAFYIQVMQRGFKCFNNFLQHFIFNHHDIYISKVVHRTSVLKGPS